MMFADTHPGWFAPPEAASALRQAGARLHAPDGPEAFRAAWSLDLPEPDSEPQVEAEVTDGMISLHMALGGLPDRAMAGLAERLRQLLLWNRSFHGGARFGLSLGLGFCLRAVVPSQPRECLGDRIQAAFRGLAAGGRAWRGDTPAENDPDPAHGPGEAMPAPDRIPDWGSLLGASSHSFHVRPDGAAALNLTTGRVILHGDDHGLRGEAELADLAGWPDLNVNALGLLLLLFNGRFRVLRAALVAREKDLAAVLLGGDPAVGREEVARLAEAFESALALCAREARALASSTLAERYLEAGIHSFSLPSA